MKIYNSKTRTKETLRPITPGKLSLYVCGPTVYDEIHIGNARTFLSFDVIRRYLIHKGYEVVFAQNLTDVDDKIIQRAREKGVSAEEIAKTYSAAFIEQMERFNILEPDIRPRATAEIDAMIRMIEELLQNGHAYRVENGDVYFSVRSVKTYGSISGRKVDELLVGARIEENKDKKDPLDFTLWKAAKPGEPAWESPWGMGRPGWHTECSAMVHTYLGTPIDIHGGGADLIFPHHENEAAQACGAWETPLANIWMHAGMLRVEGEKMSKSQGNFYTLKEVLDTYPAEALRLLMLQTHYRSPMDFSFDRLRGAVGTFEKLQQCVENLRWMIDAAHAADAADALDAKYVSLAESAARAREAFEAAMDDDFNTAQALAALFQLQSESNKWLAEADPSFPGAAEEAKAAAHTLQELLGVLGISLETADKGKEVRASDQKVDETLLRLAQTYADYSSDDSAGALQALTAARDAARAQKDWTLSDHIRDELSDAGFIVEDTPSGTRIKEA